MPSVLPQAKEETKTALAPRWHVVLLDDDDHTYEYVIEMLVKLFAKTPEDALRHAVEVDTTGRSIVDTTTKERAELKAEQIRSYGPDPRLRRSRGSMAAIIEPAE
ncbi:MAG: ATP-dependent Clp protease adaptor ClpS [Planctomycetota bacterium]|nr:ATP-dependent Clp protease adaptor ClpS [Planctomycetota bacterium]MDW8373487.1 ATP-dependent Clp protease adaptor ClpS [Planctomycetota bacterium]